MAVSEDIFNDTTPVFVASFVPELFACLLGQTQREQIIVNLSHVNSVLYKVEHKAHWLLYMIS